VKKWQQGAKKLALLYFIMAAQQASYNCFSFDQASDKMRGKIAGKIFLNCQDTAIKSNHVKKLVVCLDITVHPSNIFLQLLQSFGHIWSKINVSSYTNHKYVLKIGEHG